MDKLDFAILNFLFSNQATSKMKSKTRNDMLDNLDMGKQTLYRRIIELIKKNMWKEVSQRGNNMPTS